MRLAGLFTLLLAFSSPSYAQRACTEIGCNDGIDFTADPSFDWDNGQYEVHVAIDYKTVSCFGQLPLNACESGPTFKCDDPEVTIMESGCALPRDQHGIAGIHVAAEPRKIIVRIARNYKTIVTRTIIPQYQTSRPNGRGCGPICRSASYDLLSAN